MLKIQSVEVAVCILAACIPTLRPLFVKVLMTSQNSSFKWRLKRIGYISHHKSTPVNAEPRKLFSTGRTIGLENNNGQIKKTTEIEMCFLREPSRDECLLSAV